jgi:hypothetical protein
MNVADTHLTNVPFRQRRTWRRQLWVKAGVFTKVKQHSERLR